MITPTKLRLAVGLAGLAGLLAACQPLPPPPPPGPGETPGPDCIYTRNIDHTETPDDQTILFVMRDRTVIKNTLIAPCSGLSFPGGFTYEATNPATGQICGNLQTIRLLRSRQVCLLGAFSTMPAKPKP